MNIVGIDPGLSGAVAVILESGRLELKRCPVVEIEAKGGKRHNEMEPAMMAGILRAVPEPKLAVLEKVNAFQKGGASSNFSFGGSYWGWRCMLSALAIPYHLVLPKEWQAKMLRGQGKDASRAAAARLWPDHAAIFAPKGAHGLSDAALIAEFGRVHTGVRELVRQTLA